MSAFVIDAFEFSRLKERREGASPVSDLGRLAEELADPSGTLKWVLAGGSNHVAHPQLTLTVTGSLQITCQRCLSPFAFDVDSESVLILAKDEASADDIDALLDDDQIDVIIGSKALDIIQLVEDEALLALRGVTGEAEIPGLEGATSPARDSQRVLSHEERANMSPEAWGFLLDLRRRGSLDPGQFEEVLDQLSGPGTRPVDVATAREIAARVALHVDEEGGPMLSFMDHDRAH